jgi:hypothetical protein
MLSVHYACGYQMQGILPDFYIVRCTVLVMIIAPSDHDRRQGFKLTHFTQRADNHISRSTRQGSDAEDPDVASIKEGPVYRTALPHVVATSPTEVNSQRVSDV